MFGFGNVDSTNWRNHFVGHLLVEIVVIDCPYELGDGLRHCRMFLRHLKHAEIMV